MIALRWNIAQAFERLWWRNYLSGKDPQHYLAWKKDYWEKLLQQVYDITDESAPKSFNRQSLNVLDAGCGPAGIFLNLQNHRVDAIDPLVRRYLDELHLIDRKDFPHVNFISGNLEGISSATQYDWIFCMNCINHVKDIELCLKNISAALKKEGFFVMTVDTHKHWLAKPLLNTMPIDVLHPYQLSLDDYIRLIEKKFSKGIIRNRLLKRGVMFDYYLVVVQKKG